MSGAEPPRSDADVVLRRLLFAGAVLAPFNFVAGIPTGAVTIHPLQVWSALLVGVILTVRPRIVAQAADTPALLLWTMFAFVLVSTLVGTPSEYRLRGYLDVVLLGINLAAFTLTAELLRRDPAAWAPVARTVFAASIVSSSVLVVYAMQVAQTGVFVHPDSYILGLGTVTGTFTAAFAAAAVIGFSFVRGARLRLLMALGIVAHGMAATLSLARGPWLALAIAVAVAFLLGAPALHGASAVLGASFRGLVALLLLTTSVATATLLNPAITKLVVSRLLHVATLSSGTGRGRLDLFGGLLHDAMDSPVFGHGAATYRRVSELLGIQGSISENFLLEMFHAGGAVSAGLLVLAATIVIARVLRSLGPSTGGLAGACLAGVLALMLGALSNPAAWDTAFWVLAALAATVGAAVLRRPPVEQQQLV